VNRKPQNYQVDTKWTDSAGFWQCSCTAFGSTLFIWVSKHQISSRKFSIFKPMANIRQRKIYSTNSYRKLVGRKFVSWMFLGKFCGIRENYALHPQKLPARAPMILWVWVMHMFISKILLVMCIHRPTKDCIYTCRLLSDRHTKI